MLDKKPGMVGSPDNRDVVAYLEGLVFVAKQGHAQLFVGVTCDSAMQHKVHVVGAKGLEFSAAWGLKSADMLLRERVHGSGKNTAWSEDTADKVQYDMSTAPACYDFIPWLVNAEMVRRRREMPGPLKVGFSMREGPEEQAYHNQLRKPFYDHVILPSLALIGAVRDDSAVTAKTINKYTFHPIVEASKAGEFVPLLMAPPDTLKCIAEHQERPVVTITLREAETWEYRNSNLDEWMKVAEHLRDQGEQVVFVRDTAKADEKIKGFPICPLASRNVLIRHALYESAKLNLFVSNGPWHLAVFGNKPWRMFVELDEDSQFFPETHQFWDRLHGIDPHIEQFPWSLPEQQIIPKRDNADNIIAALPRA